MLNAASQLIGRAARSARDQHHPHARDDSAICAAVRDTARAPSRAFVVRRVHNTSNWDGSGSVGRAAG